MPSMGHGESALSVSMGEGARHATAGSHGGSCLPPGPPLRLATSALAAASTPSAPTAMAPTITTPAATAPATAPATTAAPEPQLHV